MSAAEHDWSGYDGHRPLAVFDIDGVLADVRHRLHHLQTRPQHWNAFFLAADRDPLLEEGAARLRAAQAEHEVVYLTGRPERNRALTRTWLAGHGLPTGPLHMRPDDDYRPARWVKRTRCAGWPAPGRSPPCSTTTRRWSRCSALTGGRWSWPPGCRTRRPCRTPRSSRDGHESGITAGVIRRGDTGVVSERSERTIQHSSVCELSTERSEGVQ